MAQTAKNFFGSYCDETRLVTVQYPEERLPQKENARSFPFLVFDGADAEKGLRCVACKICEKECPPQCIYIILDRDEKGKPQKHPKIFDIDLSVCMSCQICAEVCPFDAIKMDTVYELSGFDRFGELLVHKADLAKSNDYYSKIHPTEAAEVDQRLAEEKAKAEAKAKAAAAKVAPAVKPAISAAPNASAPVAPSPAGARETRPSTAMPNPARTEHPSAPAAGGTEPRINGAVVAPSAEPPAAKDPEGAGGAS